MNNIEPVGFGYMSIRIYKYVSFKIFFLLSEDENSACGYVYLRKFIPSTRVTAENFYRDNKK